MTLTEFVNLYDGTKVGAGQCVALIKQYEQEVLNLTPVAVGNAHQYFDNYENEEFLYTNFDRITYDGTNKPEIGDIVVWSTVVGQGAGHVAIAYYNIEESSFISFDQNWNTPLLCQLETHTYNNVLGWLRYKGQIPEPQPVMIEKKKFPWQIFTRKIRKRRSI